MMYVYENGQAVEEEVVKYWFVSGFETLDKLAADNFGCVSEILTEEGVVKIFRE